MSTPTIQFGILAIPYQTLDVTGPIDILSSSSKSMFETFNLPASLIPKAINIQFHHIGLSLAPVQHTANFYSVPTTTVAECPKLDYLLIGGPNPEWISTMDEKWTIFIKERLPELKTIFTTCTGGLVLAASGVLDGLNATTNHGFLETAKELFPAVKWKKERWVVDGKFSTAGGACAGMDMIGGWVLDNYGVEIAEIGFRSLDFDLRNRKGEVVML